MKKDSIVLIAEHDEKHFDMIRNSLLRAGIDNQIVRLADGRQTLEYLFEMGPQPASEHVSQKYVLFLDVNLPDVSGVEVLEKIKEDERLSKIPVIMLTVADDRPTIDRCYNLGCSTYVVKSAKNEDFSESIQNIGAFLSVVKTTSIK